MYIVVNIGCIECGVSSNIVGLFSDQKRAESIANQCREKHNWREGGDNEYMVCKLPEPEKIDPDYDGVK